MTRIVLIGGGSGSRDITMALCGAGYDVTRIVPAWDSGGSSSALRRSLGILAIGDIRQALMTMAHGEGRAGAVVRFFNARLSEAASDDALRDEFDFYADGAHPLLAQMAPEIRGAILEHLARFRNRIEVGFDLRRGSIGNFVLAGAYFAHGRDIHAAILEFRRLCAIEGNVWPSTIDDAVELSAVLRDGRVVVGQDRVTALDAEAARVGIAQVRLAGSQLGRPPHADIDALDAIDGADALVFGPGSFYSSTLPHLLVDRVAQAVAEARDTPKVLVGNLLECPETTGRTLADAVEALRAAGGPGVPTHVLANRGFVPFPRVLRGFRYLAEGPIPAGCEWIADDFEDPWRRGGHDAAKVVATLGRLVGR